MTISAVLSPLGSADLGEAAGGGRALTLPAGRGANGGRKCLVLVAWSAFVLQGFVDLQCL